MQKIKKCNKCLEQKLVSDFHSDKSKHDGLHTQCKSCKKISSQKNKDAVKVYMQTYNKEYRLRNKEALRIKKAKYMLKTKSLKKDYDRERYKLTRASIIKRNQAYYLKNRESYSEKNKVRAKNRTEEERLRINLNQRKWSKERQDSDSMYRLKLSLRSICCHALKTRFWLKRGKAAQILKADRSVVRSHFEALFTDGMTWDNHGLWEIDHVIPLSTATDEEGLIALCHYKNLQPLWKIDNMKKGKKLPTVIHL